MIDEDRIRNLEDTLELIRLQRPVIQTPDFDPEPIGEEFTPVSRLIRTFKWLGGGVMTIFLAGAGYGKFQDTNAYKADIEAHVEADLVPVRKQVHSIGSGVHTLLAERKRDLEVMKLQRQLDKFQHQYDEALANHNSRLAREKPSRRPKKSPKWIEIESELEVLLKQPVVISRPMTVPPI